MDATKENKVKELIRFAWYMEDAALELKDLVLFNRYHKIAVRLMNYHLSLIDSLR